MNKGKTNTKTTGGKKEYNPSIGFWPTKSGNGFSVAVTAELLATLNKAQEGGRLYLQEVPEDVRAENDRIPTYRVTIFPPAEQTANDSI